MTFIQLYLPTGFAIAMFLSSGFFHQLMVQPLCQEEANFSVCIQWVQAGDSIWVFINEKKAWRNLQK